MKHQIKQCNQEFQIQITYKNGVEKKKKISLIQGI